MSCQGTLNKKIH